MVTKRERNVMVNGDESHGDESHDLNPIENLWALLNAKVSEKQPSNLEALRKVIKKVWVHEISPDYWLNLISGIPRRLHEVIKNKGVHTKFKNCKPFCSLYCQIQCFHWSNKYLF